MQHATRNVQRAACNTQQHATCVRAYEMAMRNLPQPGDQQCSLLNVPELRVLPAAAHPVAVWRTEVPRGEHSEYPRGSTPSLECCRLHVPHCWESHAVWGTLGCWDTTPHGIRHASSGCGAEAHPSQPRRQLGTAWSQLRTSRRARGRRARTQWHATQGEGLTATEGQRPGGSVADAAGSRADRTFYC